jgi:hypothetical protein
VHNNQKNQRKSCCDGLKTESEIDYLTSFGTSVTLYGNWGMARLAELNSALLSAFFINPLLQLKTWNLIPTSQKP